MLFKISFEVEIDIPNMDETNWNDYSNEIEQLINAYLDKEAAEDEYKYAPIEEQ